MWIEKGHFGQMGGHYGHDLVLNTTVGMGLRVPLKYNLLLIVVYSHRKKQYLNSN